MQARIHFNFKSARAANYRICILGFCGILPRCFLPNALVTSNTGPCPPTRDCFSSCGHTTLELAVSVCLSVTSEFFFPLLPTRPPLRGSVYGLVLFRCIFASPRDLSVDPSVGMSITPLRKTQISIVKKNLIFLDSF